MIRIPGHRGGMVGAAPQDFPAPGDACPGPDSAPIYNLDTGNVFCVNQNMYEQYSCYSTNTTSVLVISQGKTHCMPFEDVKRGLNPCSGGATYPECNAPGAPASGAGDSSGSGALALGIVAAAALVGGAILWSKS